MRRCGRTRSTSNRRSLLAAGGWSQVRQIERLSCMISATLQGTTKSLRGRGSAVLSSLVEVVLKSELWTGVTISLRLVVIGLSGHGDRTSKGTGHVKMILESRSGTGVGQGSCDHGLRFRVTFLGWTGPFLTFLAEAKGRSRDGSCPTSSSGVLRLKMMSVWVLTRWDRERLAGPSKCFLVV